jgi:hypothetical protein
LKIHIRKGPYNYVDKMREEGGKDMSIFSTMDEILSTQLLNDPKLESGTLCCIYFVESTVKKPPLRAGANALVGER